MVFPSESAEQLRRRLLETCQDHFRKVLDILREVRLMISAYQTNNENEVYNHHNNILKLNEESSKKKKDIIVEVAEVGAVLLSKDDFVRLLSHVETISDYCTGISHRMVELVKRRWKVKNEIMKSVEDLCEATLNCVTKLREAIIALIYGGPKVFEVVEQVDAAEKNVDNIYRKVDIMILASRMKLPVMFIIREIAEFLEGIADVCEDTGDIVRILAITT
ncbi:MAG: DUF47 domain-containing protein [Candidatus Bathyarchaeota archaeon]